MAATTNWQADRESYLPDDDPFVMRGLVGDPLGEADYELVYQMIERQPKGQCLSVAGYRGVPMHVVLPAEWDGMPVVGISAEAFRGCESLVSIQMEESVELIGPFAFCGCKNLKTVELSWELYRIEDSTFESCTALEHIEIPDSVCFIDSQAFLGCDSLRSVDLPQSVEGIGDSAFAWCSALESIDLSDVYEVGSEAFAWCSSLKKVTIEQQPFGYPQWVEICEFAFRECTALEQVRIGRSGPNELGASAFAGCTALRTVALSGGFSCIPRNAFKGCTSLESVEVGDGLEEICDGAFAGCRSLQSLHIMVDSPYDDCDETPVLLARTDVRVAPGAFDGCPEGLLAE